MDDEILNLIWARKMAWSHAADRLGANIGRARALLLALGCVGAVFETLAATAFARDEAVRTASAAAGSVCLAVATYVGSQWLTGAATRAWTLSRSVSEALKAEFYLCRARCGPYAADDRAALLNAKTAEIEEAGADLAAQLAAAAPGGEAPPGDLDQAAYVATRVMGQVSRYLRPTAQRYARRVGLLRALAIGCGGLATVIGAVAACLSATPGWGGSDSGLAAWVAVLTTIGASIGAYISEKRYDFLILAYVNSARRLETLANEWRAHAGRMDQPSWDMFVRSCEDVIAGTNQSWMAKLMQPGA
ncbi:MAG: DUF4231 domain-containing protein [Sphingomonadaceae bacterium]|nr:DUF4231 domain-containing protein [Sphingomonadaceae bacterium]